MTSFQFTTPLDTGWRFEIRISIINQYQINHTNVEIKSTKPKGLQQKKFGNTTGLKLKVVAKREYSKCRMRKALTPLVIVNLFILFVKNDELVIIRNCKLYGYGLEVTNM